MKLIRKPFVFMRHGETALNREQRICGFTDVPLNTRGENQALDAQPLLLGDWSCVATSALQRAQRTASLAVPRHEALILPGLNERHWGVLEGAPLSQLLPYASTPAGGESWDEFSRRVLSALNGLLEEYPLPLVVAHSGVYRVIRDAITGTPDGPRIENARPVRLNPADNAAGWTLEPFENNAVENGE
ncbi:histidine phosphatase family protein [Marinobacterium rhizophilum]|uniref:phosphoglycerate mutase (2,3-diphosphoglycerate-dependent) n=1 Tax=Marinobacterium rhizophilum TaxID=420402 RepID=A0ABY5HK45_9GAMM|nr:histidine phosphatase family protein [Marinobacterium rhizophilum]UTW11644.1 histidine phosphatase family protein [Marinobacterium rhizophilum]